MPLQWTLRKWLAVERDIYKPSQLQARILEKTGIKISIQALSALMTEQPGALRIQTIQVLCDALDCDLHAFCNVTPDPRKHQEPIRHAVGENRRLYGGKSARGRQQKDAKDAIPPQSPFPSPRQFLTAESESTSREEEH